jgi:hypothetical protein
MNTYIYINMSIYVCIYMNIYIYIYVYTYICMYLKRERIMWTSRYLLFVYMYITVGVTMALYLPPVQRTSLLNIHINIDRYIYIYVYIP